MSSLGRQIAAPTSAVYFGETNVALPAYLDVCKLLKPRSSSCLKNGPNLACVLWGDTEQLEETEHEQFGETRGCVVWGDTGEQFGETVSSLGRRLEQLRETG